MDGKLHMPVAKDHIEDNERITKIGNEIGRALDAGAVTVRLLSGGEIEGGMVGFNIRKKAAKGEDTPASWVGSVRIQTAPGVLEIDCLTIDSITRNPD